MTVISAESQDNIFKCYGVFSRHTRKTKPPSQTWRTFIDNHAPELVSIDFLTVPTATFRVLFVLIVLAHNRRRVVHFESPIIRLPAGPPSR
jgi:hypothetical protein